MSEVVSSKPFIGHLVIKRAIAVVFFTFLCAKVYLILNGSFVVSSSYASLKVFLLSFGAYLMIVISEKIAELISKDIENVFPQSVERVNKDWSAIYFSLALFVWASFPFIELSITYFGGFLGIGAFHEGESKYVLDACGESLKGYISTVFSLMNTWFILLGAREISKLRNLNEDEDSTSKRWFERSVDSLSKVIVGVKGSRKRPTITVLILGVSVLMLFIWGTLNIEVESTRDTAGYVLGIIDSFFGIAVGIILLQTFYRAFRNRGYDFLAKIISFAIIAAIVTTAADRLNEWLINIEHLIDANTYKEILFFSRATYSFVLLVSFLMLSITYAFNLLEKQSLALARHNYEIDHRIKNAFYSLGLRLERMNKKAPNMDRELFFAQVEGAISAMAKLHEIIQERGLVTNYTNKAVPAKLLLETVIKTIWVNELGNEGEGMLVLELQLKDVSLTPKESSSLTRLLIEVLYNINQHSYGLREERYLRVKGSRNGSSVTLVLLDKGELFHDADQPIKSQSFGRRFIKDTARELNGSVTITPNDRLGNTTIISFSPEQMNHV